MDLDMNIDDYAFDLSQSHLFKQTESEYTTCDTRYVSDFPVNFLSDCIPYGFSPEEFPEVPVARQTFNVTLPQINMSAFKKRIEENAYIIRHQCLIGKAAVNLVLNATMSKTENTNRTPLNGLNESSPLSFFTKVVRHNVDDIKIVYSIFGTTGSILFTGNKSIYSAFLALQIQREKLLHDRQAANVTRFDIVNIVNTITLPFSINISKLYQLYNLFITYNPSVFPGVCWRIVHDVNIPYKHPYDNDDIVIDTRKAVTSSKCLKDYQECATAKIFCKKITIMGIDHPLLYRQVRSYIIRIAQSIYDKDIHDLNLVSIPKQVNDAPSIIAKQRRDDHKKTLLSMARFIVKATTHTQKRISSNQCSHENYSCIVDSYKELLCKTRKIFDTQEQDISKKRKNPDDIVNDHIEKHNIIKKIKK